MYYNNYYTQPPMMANNQNLYNVNGIEGAKAFYVPANSINYLLDSDNPYLYRKVADATGRTTLQRFKLVEENEQTSNLTNDFNSMNKKLDEVISLLKTANKGEITNE